MQIEQRTSGGEHAALLAFLESIDYRLASMEQKIDTLQASMVAKGDCASCQSRWIPRAYLTGLAVAGTTLGLVAGFLGNVTGLWDSIIKLANK